MSEVKEFSAEIIEGWRLTVPKHIRLDLGIEKGDRVKITIQKSARQRGNLIL